MRQLTLPTPKKPGFLDSRNGLHVWQGRESLVFQGSPTGAMLPSGARFFSRNGSCSKDLHQDIWHWTGIPQRDPRLNQLSTVKWGRFNHSSAWSSSLSRYCPSQWAASACRSCAKAARKREKIDLFWPTYYSDAASTESFNGYFTAETSSSTKMQPM